MNPLYMMRSQQVSCLATFPPQHNRCIHAGRPTRFMQVKAENTVSLYLIISVKKSWHKCNESHPQTICYVTCGPSLYKSS